MVNLIKITLLSFILLQINTSYIEAQLIQQDDFHYRSDYWYWRSDGNQSQPTVDKGLLHLKLSNATNTEYCNTEIYDPTEPYQPGTQVRVRLKNSSIHNGSRGWGFWDGDLDTISLVFDFDVAWVMQQGSEINDPDYNWFLFGAAGNLIANRQTVDLHNVVNETQWHTYKTIWESNSVSFYIDDKFIYETFSHLPNDAMRMDIWIDNRVINLANPTENWNNNVESSEMLVDFVEIAEINGPNIQRTKEPGVVLWESPNTFPNGNIKTLWKSYDFITNSDGEALIFLTGSAESYGTLMDDDDLKIVIDNQDYGWDTKNSFDGNTLHGKGKSIVMTVDLTAGEHNLDIYSDITPFLHDAIVVYSENGKLIYSRNYNETANRNDGLWKTIEFNTDISREVTILLSGMANEKSGIRFELDSKNYGWNGNDAIDGGDLQGLPNTVVINEMLDAGTHSLRIHKKGSPQLYSIAIYGNSLITNIKNDAAPSESVYLRANPNPFNISTNIYYKTQSTSHNNITIVNVLGQKVATLVDNYQQKGEYNLVWNANSETSGIYFCILESDNYFRVEKLLLLK